MMKTGSLPRLRLARVLRLLVVTLAGAHGMASGQVSAELCGPIHIPGDFGPYDYRTDKYYLPVVERAHFTPQVEALIKGNTTKLAGEDIDYTLRKFPNHHRALMAVLRLSQKKMAPGTSGLRRDPECYFERALRWRADDAVARMVYARFLGAHGRRDDALAQLKRTANGAGDSVITHRNIGLLYLEMNAVQEALSQAHRVLAIDPSEAVLKDALQKAGHWKAPANGEPAAAGASAAAPAAGSASAGPQ